MLTYAVQELVKLAQEAEEAKRKEDEERRKREVSLNRVLIEP
jgi:hypothetical protein